MVTNRRREEPPLPDLTVLVGHSLDFIESSVRLLQSSPLSEQQTREVVVLLAIGVEHLLKARLMMQDWSLVFDKREEADREKLARGKFRSVSGSACLDRLEKACGIVVNDATRKAFERLWRFRNQLVHYSVALPIDALIPVAFEILSHVTDLSTNWLPDDVADQHERLAAALRTLAPYTNARQATIAAALTTSGTASFYCPKCEERTIVNQNGERRCLFCASVDEIFQEITDVHLRNEVGEGAAGDISICMRCDGWYSAVLERRGSSTVRCLQCWETADKSTLRHCVACDHWLIPPVDAGVQIACPDCTADVASSR